MTSPDLAEQALARVRAVCAALPETEEAEDNAGARFRVRRRIFAQVATVPTPDGGTATLLICRAEPEERQVLMAIGHPFFVPGSGADRIGMVMANDTDWDEVAELVTESYLRLAPKNLAAQVENTLG